MTDYQQEWLLSQQWKHLIYLKLNGTHGVDVLTNGYRSALLPKVKTLYIKCVLCSVATYIRLDGFKLFCSLCTPKKPEQCSDESLKAKMDSQHGIKKLVLVDGGAILLLQL